MDWNGNHMRALASRPENSSFGFLYNYNNDQYPAEVEVKHHHPMMIAQMEDGALLGAMEKNNYANQLERKKRLTSDQLESLETSFQEEIKLDPDRKMKLAQELGLQPRQIAVWFQNRRARWKNKQLERLYDALKQEFDAVSREKQKLQEEVVALRTIVKEQVTMKQQYSAGGYTEISGDETVESTSVAAIRSSNNNPLPRSLLTHDQNVGGCNYVFNVDGCNLVMPPPPYWGVLPPPYP